MDLIGEERGRLTRAADWLQATRAELLGLAVLLTGCVVVTGMVWLSPLAGGTATEPASTPGIGSEVDPDGLDAGVDEDGAWVADDHDAAGADAPGDEAAGHLTVHVSGAVVDPGLFTLPAGARVGDALHAADGLTDDADADVLNLAQPLGDGDRIHVPREGEEPRPETAAGATSGRSGSGDGPAPVDINRAGTEELETLPGIGPARARTIIEHREAHGPFAEPGDLRAVSGIGEATFQRLADLIHAS